MKLDMENPGTLAARAPKRFNSLAALNNSEDTAAAHNLQHFRASFLARKHRISSDLAAVVAALAFGQAAHNG